MFSKRAHEINIFDQICGLSSPNTDVSPKTFTIKEELAYYLSTKNESSSDICVYWREKAHKLPMLSSLVKKYCIISASSVPSESAFSIANYVERKERSSLSAETLKYSMMLREKIKIENLIKNNDFIII